MIAPEYFNNHVAVEGEIIVKSVPNEAGFVLVWNPATKKISRRTHTEIVSDLNLVTSNQLGNYWQRYNGSSWNEIRSDKAVVILDELGNQAQNIYTGGLLVSNVYADSSNIPTNGIYSKGNIATLNYGSASDWNAKVSQSQLNDYVTLNTEQNIEGAKWFKTIGGNQYLNHRLRIISEDNSNPGMVFYKSGVNVGTIQYDGSNYLFTTSDTNAFANLVSAGFIKEGSNNGYALLGGGGHKPISDFALINHTHSFLQSTATGEADLNNLINDYTFNYYPVIYPTSTNLFPNAVDNANGLISISTHPDYGIQLGINTYGDIYKRDLQNGNFSVWAKIITSTELANYQPLGQYVRVGGDNTTGNNILLGWTGSQAQLTVDATTIGNLWHSGNLNPSNFLQNDKIASKSIGVVATTLDAELPNGGFISSYYSSSWAGTDRPDGASYGGYIKFSEVGGDNNNLDFYYNNGHNGDVSRLWFRTKESVNGVKSWMELWHSGNFNPSNFLSNDGTNTLKTIDTSNYNDVVDGNGKIWLGNFYSLPTSTTGFQNSIGTILNINGLVSHDKTQLIFNGDNGSIQYRTSWYQNSPWSPVRTLWDSNNFDPSSKVNALENATGIGFSNGNISDAPYVYHSSGGLSFLATQNWVNAELTSYVLQSNLNSQLGNYVNKLGDTMTGALLIGNNNIGKQRVLHLAEPTLLDSYGFNFYTDTSTGLLTLQGLNNGLNNSAPILSANRANNFVGINKENATTELDVNGNITSNGFIKNNSSDDYCLMGGGGQLTKYSKDDAFVNSYRDFTDGTLITTNIDYSQTQGESFLLEIKGNMYGGGIPMDTKVQGYIYADTIINQSGY